MVHLSVPFIEFMYLQFCFVRLISKFKAMYKINWSSNNFKIKYFVLAVYLAYVFFVNLAENWYLKKISLFIKNNYLHELLFVLCKYVNKYQKNIFAYSDRYETI